MKYLSTIIIMLFSLSVTAETYSTGGVEIADVAIGIEENSFRVVEGDIFLPMPCPDDTIHYPSNLLVSDTTFTILSEMQDKNIRVKYIEYKYNSNGDCSLWKLIREDVSGKPWSVDRLILSDIIQEGRLVAYNCPYPWDHGAIVMWAEFLLGGAGYPERMVPITETICRSGNGVTFQMPLTGKAYWRVVDQDGNETNWTELTGEITIP